VRGFLEEGRKRKKEPTSLSPAQNFSEKGKQDHAPTHP
jgi:hypothetical protein